MTGLVVICGAAIFNKVCSFYFHFLKLSFILSVNPKGVVPQVFETGSKPVLLISGMNMVGG